MCTIKGTSFYILLSGKVLRRSTMTFTTSGMTINCMTETRFQCISLNLRPSYFDYFEVKAETVTVTILTQSLHDVLTTMRRCEGTDLFEITASSTQLAITGKNENQIGEVTATIDGLDASDEQSDFELPSNNVYDVHVDLSSTALHNGITALNSLRFEDIKFTYCGLKQVLVLTGSKSDKIKNYDSSLKPTYFELKNPLRSSPISAVLTLKTLSSLLVAHRLAKFIRVGIDDKKPASFKIVLKDDLENVGSTSYLQLWVATHICDSDQ